MTSRKSLSTFPDIDGFARALLECFRCVALVSDVRRGP